jgi:uncharacterized protein with GYD domain
VPTYISLLNWTQLGDKNVKETRKRETVFAKAAQRLGVKVIAAYWTMGRYDGVLIFDAPNDQTATAAALSLSSMGSVVTQTMRAFTAEEMEKIVGLLGK